MIRIKLKEIAENKGKTITDIANETGLNRNTVTSIYHGQVDGIKFDTLEKIRETYNLSLSDLIEDVAPLTKGIKKISFGEPYKQDGDAIPLTGILPPFLGNQQPKDFFDTSIGNHICFFKKEYGYYYWEKDKMETAARSIVDRYKNEEELNKLFEAFKVCADKLEYLYRYHTEDKVRQYSEEQLKNLSQEIVREASGFWKLSLFIDVFDSGFDVQKIKEIQLKFNLSDDEVSTLTNPDKMTFNNERILSLLKIVKKVSKHQSSIKNKKDLKTLVYSLPEIHDYILDFDYYQSNYSFIKHITLDDIVDEIYSFLENDKWVNELEKLDSYSIDQKKKENLILRRLKIKTNPLFFFKKLIYWREYRKQINLMSIHLFHYIIMDIEEKTGIPYKYLKHLVVDEIPNVFKGLITVETLESRYNRGVILYTTSEGDYHMLVGEEAESIFNEMEKKILGEETNVKIITGRVACQGYARGVARIILGLDDFSRFKEGEILVTGMTRPEFVPLMKKSLAIVTNEGGVTCHAAIVSRELNKPCIIGTQKATQVIKDGDIIEVRANHGTVRILS